MKITIIECACKGCEVKATELGKAFPLQAWVTEALAKVVGKNTHATVELAHHPVLALSAGVQSNIWAVA
jgi:hypothetical protein